ncbi:MAG: DUF2786 domain-containing protein [Planctomycetota bacterium]
MRRLDPDDWERSLAEDQEVMARRELSEALEQQCLRRLAECWGDLSFIYLRSTLRAPSFRLTCSERQWGSWDPERRLISIARRQVLCYTWESVVETLKHEVAHQYVSEVLRRDHEPPHGPAFQEACRLLACDPSPTGDGGVPLHRDAPLAVELGEGDARLRKIHKLLALADNNPDEHEAQAAFARASELMLKYNLDGVRGPTRHYTYRYLGRASGRTPHYRYQIASILQEYFFVQCIWVDSYDVARGVRGSRLEVMGTRANVDMAEYVHDCLERQCQSLWQRFKAEREITDRRAKRHYLDGLLAGFRRQLNQSQTQSAERGLIWIGDPELNAFARERYPRTTRTRLDAVGHSDVRSEGVRAGERIRLHQPVASARDAGLALPG